MAERGGEGGADLVWGKDVAEAQQVGKLRKEVMTVEAAAARSFVRARPLRKARDRIEQVRRELTLRMAHQHHGVIHAAVEDPVQEVERLSSVGGHRSIP